MSEIDYRVELALALQRLEQRVAELERRLFEQSKPPGWLPPPYNPQSGDRMAHCGCPVGTVCCNVACPHLAHAT